jgi:hypothetical protein
MYFANLSNFFKSFSLYYLFEVCVTIFVHKRSNKLSEFGIPSIFQSFLQIVANTVFPTINYVFSYDRKTSGTDKIIR